MAKRRRGRGKASENERTGDGTARAFCNLCHGEKDHVTLWQHQQQREVGEGLYRQVVDDKCSVLRCGGCRSLRFRLTMDCPEFRNPTVAEYPAAMRKELPSWNDDLPANLKEVYRDVHVALQAGVPRLSLMGARAIIEMTLDQALANQEERFCDKLATAVSERILTEFQKETLEVAVEAGHAAIHRGFIPDDEQIDDVLDIVDYLLRTVFILDGSATRLRSGIPPRSIRRKD